MLENQHLTRLEQLGGKDIGTIEAPHDLRNYIVKSEGEVEIGRVSDLLYDIQSRKVRYLVIQLNAQEGLASREILAPIGMVDCYEPGNFLVISALNTKLIDSLPDYIPGEVNPGVENMVRLAYAGQTEDADCSGLTGNEILSEGEHFYSHSHFILNEIFEKTDTENFKIVSGVFDDSLEAENSISELLSNGFSRATIEVSSPRSEKEEPAMEVSGSGSVVSVKISTETEALRVSEILDKNGSVSVYEH